MPLFGFLKYKHSAMNHIKSNALNFCLFSSIFIYYFALVTHVRFDPFQVSSGGLVFNDMCLRLLKGDFTIDPGIIGAEAYVSGGRTYAYFGVVPALARIPFLLFLDLRVTTVSSLICSVIAFSGAVLNYRTILIVVSDQISDLDRYCLLIVAHFSGIPFYLLGSISVYTESVLWSMLFSAIFIQAFILYRSGGRHRWRQVLFMALAAGVCLNTRVTTGAMLCCALGAVIFGQVRDTLRARAPVGMGFVSENVAPLVCLVGFGLVAVYVNYQRWGSPFEFADLSKQIYQQKSHPERISIIHRYGLFSPLRLFFGLQYYFFPIWGLWDSTGHSIFASFMRRYMHGAEFPPTSFLLTDTLWIGIAWAGVRSFFSASLPGALSKISKQFLVDALVLCCFAAIPIMMLMHLYAALRYRVEFFPAIFLSVLLALSARRDEKVIFKDRKILIFLTVISVLGSLVAEEMSLMPSGPTSERIMPESYLGAVGLGRGKLPYN